MDIEQALRWADTDTNLRDNFNGGYVAKILADEVRRLREIADAAQNLIDQKGRHNTQIAYERLASALKTPNVK